MELAAHPGCMTTDSKPSRWPTARALACFLVSLITVALVAALVSTSGILDTAHSTVGDDSGLAAGLVAWLNAGFAIVYGLGAALGLGTLGLLLTRPRQGYWSALLLSVLIAMPILLWGSLRPTAVVGIVPLAALAMAAWRGLASENPLP
jgi:hypothetical protein